MVLVGLAEEAEDWVGVLQETEDIPVVPDLVEVLKEAEEGDGEEEVVEVMGRVAVDPEGLVVVAT